MSVFVAEQARRMRVDPDRLAKQLADNGQLGSVASEVLRGKALDLIAQRAKVTDEAGRELDLQPPASEDATDEAGEAADPGLDADEDQDQDQETRAAANTAE
jgi:trigger factor